MFLCVLLPALLTLATSVRDISKQGSVVLKVVSATHRIVIFELPYRKAQKAMIRRILNSQETKTDFNSKVLNFNMGMFYIKIEQPLDPEDSAIHFSYNPPRMTTIANSIITRSLHIPGNV